MLGVIAVYGGPPQAYGVGSVPKRVRADVFALWRFGGDQLSSPTPAAAKGEQLKFEALNEESGQLWAGLLKSGP